MGANQTKDFEKNPSTGLLPDIMGCDHKGTFPCKDSTLYCMNGGICALYLRDTDLKCVEKCKCPKDFIGDYCQFYAGLYPATIGLVIGLFLSLLFVIFIAIFIWYCCSRKRRKNDLLESGGRGPERAFLANRVDNPAKVGPLDFQVQTIPSTRAGPSGSNERNNPILNDSTSRSYSIYDNVAWNEDHTDCMIDVQNANDPTSQTVDCVGVPEAAQLLNQSPVGGIHKGSPGSGHEIPIKHQCDTQIQTDPDR